MLVVLAFEHPYHMELSNHVPLESLGQELLPSGALECL